MDELQVIFNYYKYNVLLYEESFFITQFTNPKLTHYHSNSIILAF